MNDDVTASGHGSSPALRAQEKAVVDFIERGPFCRDCADEDRICPHNGLPCDPDLSRKAIMYVLDRLYYGMANGYLPPYRFKLDQPRSLGASEEPLHMTMNLADTTAKHVSEWTEDDGPVLWWTHPITEAPYIGSPLDAGHTVEVITRFYHGGEVVEKLTRQHVGGWPGYHTHWTTFEKPTFWHNAPRGERPEGDE